MGDPGHHDGVLTGIPGWLPARCALNARSQDLCCLIAELAEQRVGAGSDPEGEASGSMLAELQLGDPVSQLIDDGLAVMPHRWQ
jgi:hypothetical protein